MAEPQPRRSMRSLDAMGRLLADGVALRNRCPQGQADPRAAIAGGASGVTMARAGPHPRRARSMRWADVYVPHVSPASMLLERVGEEQQPLPQADGAGVGDA